MRSVLAGLLVLALVLPAAAQELKVTAAFDALEIRPDDITVYAITVSGGELPRLRRDPSPDFSAFRVVSGPSRGSSTYSRRAHARR